MSNFCSLQFSICFLQNLQGALQLTPMNNIVPQVVIELTYFWFRWEYSDDIPLTYRQGMISAAPCGKGGYLHLLSFSCRRVLWPINMVIPPTHGETKGERELWSVCVWIFCMRNTTTANDERRESGYSPTLHSREMTPFPAAIIADFTLGKGKREERRFGCSKSTVESVKTLSMCTYK